MTWNYRLVKHDDTPPKSKSGKYVYYGLHEVYYNDDGSIYMYAPDPDVVGDSIEEIRESLEMMLRDVERSKDDILTDTELDELHDKDLHA